MARADIRIEWAADWRQQLLDLGEPGLDRAAHSVLAQMKERIPVSPDGSHGRPAGFAKSKLHVLGIRDEIGLAKDVGTDATSPEGYSYPVGLENGVKPHVIRSHGPYPLRSADGRVFGREVQHPGNKPMPWARPALYSIRGRRF